LIRLHLYGSKKQRPQRPKRLNPKRRKRRSSEKAIRKLSKSPFSRHSPRGRKPFWSQAAQAEPLAVVLFLVGLSFPLWPLAKGPRVSSRNAFDRRTCFFPKIGTPPRWRQNERAATYERGSLAPRQKSRCRSQRCDDRLCDGPAPDADLQRKRQTVICRK
jgi:hypothetical protein